MSVDRVAGYPDYSNNGSSRFIPQLWAGKLIEKFYMTTVWAAISNTDYQGMIKDQGDTVIIRSTPTLAINNYVKGQKLDYERPESTAIELLIDKGKYFGFTCDDIDAYQSDIKLMNTFSADAAEQMKIAIDSDVLDTVSADFADTTTIAAANQGATAGLISSSFNLGSAATSTAVQITKANVLEYIVDCGTVLDEQNVPETGRWMIVPSWFSNLIKKSDLKDASMTNDATSPIRNGRLGIIDRFTLYQSNNLYVNATHNYFCLFGTNAAITFAAQMVKMETLRAESTFGDLVRGLHVYGFRVMRPEAIGLLYCEK